MADFPSLEVLFDRLRRFSAGGKAVLVAQVMTGVLCLTGASIAANQFLSGVAETSPPKATFATAEEWPEIKNGVPELASKPPTRAEDGTSHRPSAVVETARIQAGAGERDVAPGLSGVAPPSLAPNEPPRPHPNPVQLTASSQTAAHTDPLAPAHPASTESAVPSDVEVPKPTAPSVSSAAPAEPARGALPKEAKKPVVSKKAETRAPEGRALAQPGKARSASGSAQSKAREERTAASKRTRTAAAQTQTTPATASPTALAPTATEEAPTRLLGIPLPSGRKVKECLLELRC